MSRYVSDEALRRAAAELAEARIAAQPSPEECGHEFSPAFQRAMEKLLQKGKRRAVWRRVASIAASLLLVLAIGGGIVLAVSPEARAAVVNWLREQYENSIIYRFWGGGETSDFPAYRVGWLPEGYELLQEIEEPPYAALYQSANGSNQVIFSFGTFEEMKNMVISGDDISNREELTIQGAHGEYIPDEDGQGGDLVWIDEKREIAFAISSSLDKDTMIKIAENILQK